ncbi:HrpT family type III secretion system protein [Pantoea sp. BAV 3049]|uniref:HrpT family type III secretion system protein n=1 Tax=Pantoea sp. BAV 3049 TaxID=2654188 RepID=UPI00131E6248|nr:HrpT family type III secretion system protein [Pantoea sp. BAV 3049]
MKKPFLVLALALLLSACAKPKFAGCNDVSCRPVSDDHAMTIWWQPDMRNGPFDYSQASVNE